MSNKILIVDDEPLNLDLLEQELADKGYRVEKAASGKEALRCVKSWAPDLMLLDYMMPGMDGMQVLRELKSQDLSVPVIMVTAYGSIGNAVEAMKQGAEDFLTKPIDNDHLLLAVEKTLKHERAARNLQVLSEERNRRYEGIVGSAYKTRLAVEAARKAARSNATVLLLGESGTGKELFAHAIHHWSHREGQPFVAINCVGLSHELLESELFGYEKGAFTGADQLKRGKIELANGGTVFLDEVGDISASLQTKLLRFLSEREFERVGGTRTIPADVRIIAATNRDLEKAVEAGGFRKDLYFRLHVVPITLPPLRERKEDIPTLTDFFLRRFSAETKKPFTGITEDAMAKLIAHDWPGNIRELMNLIERALVLGEGPEIVASDLPGSIGGKNPARPYGEARSYHDAVEEFKRDLVLKILDEVKGNRSAAARILNLQRNYFSRLIKNLGIS